MADSGAEWLVEEGIGEHRALLVGSGQAIAAKLHWPGELLAGSVVEAKLVSKPSGASRGIAIAKSSREILVRNLPKSINEGETIAVELTRSPIAERSRFKPSQGKYCEDFCRVGNHPLFLPEAKRVRSFPEGIWEEIWFAASQGEVQFEGGSLHIDNTSAMILIDVDGEGAPKDLSIRAVPEIARLIRQFDLAGSIGIDFPTISEKEDRKRIDEALSSALADWPHERTAMNGFGFVQLIAQFRYPSLLHRFVNTTLSACARFALRQAEKIDAPGVVEIGIHPEVAKKLRPEWVDELKRRTGREVRIRTDDYISPESPYTQAVPQ